MTQKNAMPDYLEELPEGYVYLGKGGEFKILSDCRVFAGIACDEVGDFKWDEEEFGWEGISPKLYYAAPADSEIAKLNGFSGSSKEEEPDYSDPLYRASVLKAFAEEKEIEYKNRFVESMWQQNQHPIWDFASFDYRVAIPKPPKPITYVGVSHTDPRGRICMIELTEEVRNALSAANVEYEDPSQQNDPNGPF